MGDLVVLIFILAGTYLIGTKVIEKNHYKSISKREKKFLFLPAISSKNIIEQTQVIERAEMVYGNVVISIDFFKKFLGGIINLFGGEMTSYETVIDRARREAILRMKESSPDSDIIINTRIETSSIGQSIKKNAGCSEIIAYGTAIKYKGSITEKLKKELETEKWVKSTQIEQKTKDIQIKNIVEPIAKNNLFEYITLIVGIIIFVFFIGLLLKN
ncbi:MAG: heavy metal-binding domain-containing protein [Candidatus Omnitrophica bacterium]|nr:heavy metal-binding domain-containing protein [Candidatus Omnitrophota bacterium]